MERRKSLSLKIGAGLLLFALAAAGCTGILGIDKDFREVDGGTGGTVSTTGGTGGVASSASTSTSTGAGGAGPGASTSTGAGGAGPLTLHYKATVADCVDTAAPNPDACEQAYGTGRMSTDLLDNQTGHPYFGFLRFDLDGALAGRTVVAVTLRLTITTDSNAESTSSGVIWQVSAFDRPSLFTTVPSRVGGSPVAGDLGPVNSSMTTSWSLPVVLVAPNMPLYLGLEPVTDDAARYWNKNGATPPDLVIDVQ